VGPAKSGGSSWTLFLPDRNNTIGRRFGARADRSDGTVAALLCFVSEAAAVESFVVSAALLALLVAGGIAAIVAIRSRWLRPGDDHGDWETALVGYKNLRDKGVLSEEEYRKISTLVEPRVRLDESVPDRVPRPNAGGRTGAAGSGSPGGWTGGTDHSRN